MDPKPAPPSTRDAILQAATELFARRGYNATSMREIAAAVPLRAAGIYYWYESKSAILMHLQRSFLDDLHDAVQEAVAHQDNPASRLAAAVRVHVHYHGLYPQVAFVTDSELRALTGEDQREVQAKRDAYQAIFVGIVEDGVRRGVFTTTDVRIACYAILLECTGVAMWFDPAGNLPLERVAAIHIELTLGSLFVRRATMLKALRDANADGAAP